VVDNRTWVVLIQLHNHAYVIAQYNNNWKFSIWIILFICAPVGIVMVFMKETSKSRILYLRAKKRGEKIIGEKDEVPVMKKIGIAMLRPLHMCTVEVCSCLYFSTALLIF